MPTLYFAFANDPDHPLDELKREDAEINRLLEPLAARGYFKIVRDSFATLDMVADKLSLYKKDLVLFHYSGHAGPGQIQLDGEAARTKGIAALLSACPQLQLVVLNGCATYNQVRLLHEQQTPVVIATHRPVEDTKAAVFAIQFYRSLAQLDHLAGAFETARGKVLAMDAGLEIMRGLALRGDVPAAPCWGLFIALGGEESMTWRLPRKGKKILRLTAASIVGIVLIIVGAIKLGYWDSFYPQLGDFYQGADKSFTYVVRDKDEIFWFSEHPGIQYSYVFRGKIKKKFITGDWWSIPKESKPYVHTGKGIVIEILKGGKNLKCINEASCFPEQILERSDVNLVPGNLPPPKDTGWPRKEDSRDVDGIWNTNIASIVYLRSAPNGIDIAAFEESYPTSPAKRPEIARIWIGRLKGRKTINVRVFNTSKGEKTGPPIIAEYRVSETNGAVMNRISGPDYLPKELTRKKN